MRKKNYKNLFEATADRSGSSGSYVPPLQPGERPFEKSQNKKWVLNVLKPIKPLIKIESEEEK